MLVAAFNSSNQLTNTANSGLGMAAGSSSGIAP
jgi:hypothetical protein